MDGFVENAKGVVSIVRDGLITLVLIFLIATPAWVNQRLMNAGFVKGSIAGFEWQAAVKDNNAKLTEATNTINALQGRLGITEAALKDSEEARQQLADQVKATVPDSPVADTASAPPPVRTDQILQQNQEFVKNSQVRENVLRRQIQLNDNLLARVGRPPAQ